MQTQVIIDKTVKILHQLPDEKIQEISDFASFLLMKYEEILIEKNIEKIVSERTSFEFLKDDEIVYQVSDAREVYDKER